ncbi:MAG: tripartite tricarboxylate transporter TctB family protein [Propioniciclava sp.]
MTGDHPQPGSAAGVADPAEPTTAAPSPTLEKVTAAVVLVFGAAMLVGARSIAVRTETGGIDPRWWPTATAVGILISGCAMAFNALTGRRGTRDVEPAQPSGWPQMILTVVGLAIVLALWEIGVSFLLLGPLYLVALNWVYGLRTWKSLLLFPATVAVLLYLVFQLLLKVPL